MLVVRDRASLAQLQCASLSVLAAKLRELYPAFRETVANALAVALTTGDVLLEVKARKPEGGWLRWVSTNCPELGLSTARLFVQLAQHRTEIEARREEFPDLSIRAARELIKAVEPSTEHDEPPAPEEQTTSTVEELIRLLRSVTDAELTKALATLEVVQFFRVLPDKFRKQIEGRAVRQVVRRARPNAKARDLVHLIVDNDDTPASHQH